MGTLYPAVNRIANTGYDGSGIHSGTGTPMNEHVAEAPYTLRAVEVDPRLQHAFRRVYSGRPAGHVLREALALSPRLAGFIDGPVPSHPLVMPLLTLFLTAVSAPSATVQPALCGCRA